MNKEKVTYNREVEKAKKKREKEPEKETSTGKKMSFAEKLNRKRRLGRQSL
jgi:hypothetical protein